MGKRAITVGFCALMLAGGLTGVAPSQAAQTDSVMHEVQFAQFLTGAPGEVLAAFPERLVVHPGDTVHFSGHFGEEIPETGVHLVQLLPGGMSVDEWSQEEFLSPTGEWATFATDPDEDPEEAPEAWKLNSRVVWPSHPYCGHSEEAPCDFDGSEGPLNGVLNSGVGLGLDSFLDFYVRITAAPGTTIWALCPFHPGIRIPIEVVDASEALPPGQAAADSIAARMPRYNTQAAALHANHVDKQVSVKGRGSSRIWEAWPGLERGPIFLADMYPDKLVVRKGDSVRWHFPTNEIHTVTMPLEGASAITWLTAQCDLDTDQGSLDDAPAAPVPPFCAGGPLQYEGDLAHEFPFMIGDNEFTHATDFANSGVRSPGYPGLPTAPYTLRFPSLSPTAGFTYVCLLHPSMRGTVVVGNG
ncbi:MAG TPA: hypothetical protein VNC78_07210 [Actinomycetota bacterium]|nr:hypothetical protein [Actinomycetota bacterium]